MKSEERLLRQIGIDYDLPDTGCCGMAGSFGFEASKNDISKACGERVLLPAVRSAGKDTLIIADGFSCREQIEQLTSRHALHTAQVLKMPRETGPRGPAGNFPEQNYLEHQPGGLKPLETALLATTGFLLASVATWLWRKVKNY